MSKIEISDKLVETFPKIKGNDLGYQSFANVMFGQIKGSYYDPKTCKMVFIDKCFDGRKKEISNE